MKAAVKAELDRLKSKSGNGLLTVGSVLAAARDKNNPLHSEFTWDARTALKINLENEARALIREYQIVIVTPNGPMRTRHFVSLHNDRHNGGGYRVVSEVLGDEELAEQLLQQALAEWEGFAARYQRLKDLSEVFKAMEVVRAKHQRKPMQRRRPRHEPPSVAA